MTTITIERALLEQALTALTYKGTMGPTRRQRRMAAVDALRAALSAPATAPDELERLKAESEERLQNCAALVAEVERLRAAPATAPEQMPLERDCICHQYLHLDAYSGGAAPEGLHGALWVVVEGVRKKYVLADQSSEPKDMPALATTPKQPRPFVPWSKEAEMLESWAAQRVPDADDILRVVCETDPADFNDKRNICISPEDLGDILRDALPSPTPTASKLHVWQAAKATCPAWHDAPTVPGLWVSDFSWMAQKLGRETVEFYAKNRSIPSRRWYGPMPEDKP